MDSADWTAPAEVKVGCVTTDFAMQVGPGAPVHQRVAPRLPNPNPCVPECSDPDRAPRLVPQWDAH